MLKTPLSRVISFAALGVTLGAPELAQAAFLEDSKASLHLRNFYMNNDNRQEGNTGRSYSEEWAQGFTLMFQSGYTEGTVGFGLDLMGQLGVKLDSGKGRAGTGLLPVHNDGDVPSEYSKLGVTVKMKYAATEAKFGTMMPKFATLRSNDTRLLHQTFRGLHVQSNDIKNFTFDFGRFDRVSARNSPANEKMQMFRGDRGFDSYTNSKNSDQFSFAGATWKATDTLTLRYDWANLDGLYHQHFFSLNHLYTITEGHTLSTDLRLSRSSDDGDSNIDNKHLGLMVTYATGGHKVAAAWQQMNGDTGFTYIAGTDPYLVNYVQAGNYGNADEKSWQLRYDYNFAAIGIPGLTFMTRYVSGRDIDRANGDNNGKEWERNMDIGYVFQDGWLKDVGVKWRNATYRQDGTGADLDQNRLIVNYTIPLM